MKRPAFALLLGMLSSVACDEEPPPNLCLEFLRCYAGCRDEQQLQEVCDMGVVQEDAVTADHERCYNACANGSFLDPSIFWFYPLENRGGYTWGKIAACLDGEQL